MKKTFIAIALISPAVAFGGVFAEHPADNTLIGCIVILVLFIVSALITRLIFSVPSMVAQSKAQTRLLIKIAEKSEVDKAQIKHIMDGAKFRYDGNGNPVDQ